MFHSAATCCHWQWWCCLISRTESFCLISVQHGKGRRLSKKSGIWTGVCRSECSCQVLAFKVNMFVMPRDPTDGLSGRKWMDGWMDGWMFVMKVALIWHDVFITGVRSSWQRLLLATEWSRICGASPVFCQILSGPNSTGQNACHFTHGSILSRQGTGFCFSSALIFSLHSSFADIH